MNGEKDIYLEKMLAKYDDWLGKGQISFSSRVVPVSESLSARQWVLPQGQVMGILEAAEKIALQNCICRTRYNRCDKPLEVCFVFNGAADRFVSKGDARYVSLTEAAEVLQEADRSGLVHLSLYMPDHEVFALCSCCSCCCHDFQIVRKYDRKELMVRSDYVAETDEEACTHCGDCVERCAFDARTVSQNLMTYDAAACKGCGLCVSVCPVDATSLSPLAP